MLSPPPSDEIYKVVPDHFRDRDDRLELTVIGPSFLPRSDAPYFTLGSGKNRWKGFQGHRPIVI